jgi:phosphoribosylformylglycinamidine synthase
MKNDYGKGENKISIPPTLLYSLFGDQPDVRFTATSDFKNTGERIYLVGESKEELGASEISFMLCESGEVKGIGGQVPLLPHPEKNLKLYRALSTAIQAGLVRTAHDCSEGGVAVAVAEMCIGGRVGANIDIDGTGEATIWSRMWGESLGRFIIGVQPEEEADFQKWMAGYSITFLGEVTDSNRLIINDGFEVLVDSDTESLVSAWQKTLDLTGGVA